MGSQIWNSSKLDKPCKKMVRKLCISSVFQIFPTSPEWSQNKTDIKIWEQVEYSIGDPQTICLKLKNDSSITIYLEDEL